MSDPSLGVTDMSADGVPQMLECYLQLSRRAGDRQLPSANIGLACHSSPHWGGAVLSSAERP